MLSQSITRCTLAALVVMLPSASLAEDSSDRIRRLRERLMERSRDRDPEAPDAAGTVEATPSATEAPAPTSAPGAPSPSTEAGDDDLDEAERSAMSAVAGKVVDDEELLAAGGFQVLSGDDPVDMSYPMEEDEAEYILEVQSQIKVPGAKAPLPHRRLLVVTATREPGAGETLDWTFTVAQASETKMVTMDGETQPALVPDEGLTGAVVPLTTNRLGVPTAKDQAVTSEKFLEWLKLVLPSRPKRPGYGWRTLIPRQLGSLQEAVGGIYLLHRRVQLGGERELAVVRGRFRGRGAEAGASQFASRGQDRVLFDLARGRVLYREFRVEGSYLRNTPQGPQPYQARIKGLVMERSLLEGLSVDDRKARLNAATALFGQ